MIITCPKCKWIQSIKERGNTVHKELREVCAVEAEQRCSNCDYYICVMITATEQINEKNK